jgi:putative endonuclease
MGVLRRKVLKFVPCFLRPKTAGNESTSPPESGSSPAKTAEVGKRAEEAACKFLKKKGYKIIARNYRTRLGELDVVALDGKTLVFVEVRSKKEGNFGPPGASISREKSHRLVRAAWDFLTKKGIRDRDCRFDVVGVVYKEGTKSPQVSVFKNAFSPGEFGRR